VAAHPEIFTLSAGSPVAVLTRDVIGPDDTDDVQEALRACPAQAISLAED
jgi:ferredoxin